MSELVHTVFLPPEFVVYGLLPAGLSNLAGRSKVGKPLLANQIAVAVDKFATGWRRAALIRRGCGKGILYCVPQDEPGIRRRLGFHLRS